MTKRELKRRYQPRQSRSRMKWGTKLKICILLILVACVAYSAGGRELKLDDDHAEGEAFQEMQDHVEEEEDGFDLSLEKDCDGEIKGVNIKL